MAWEEIEAKMLAAIRWSKDRLICAGLENTTLLGYPVVPLAEQPEQAIYFWPAA